jgi:transcriptional regulator with XRE-family HTH domain
MNGGKLTRIEMGTVFSAKDLRKYRDEYCLSQEYIANLLEMHQSTYQRIESGKIKLSTNHIEKLTNIFSKISWPFIKSGNSSGEVELMKKIIAQLEKRIEELEEKVTRKNLKIEELKKQIDTSL